MDITFTEEKTVEIRMESYIDECLEAFGEKITHGVATPAKKDLFEVNDDAELYWKQIKMSFLDTWL